MVLLVSPARHVEKNLSGGEISDFFAWCGEIWYFSTWGVFSNIAIWKMWINLKFLHIWHMCDEENGSTCVKFMLFCCKIGFVAIYTLLSQIFLSRFTLFSVEKKLTNNCVVGEKMTNIRCMGKICCNTATNPIYPDIFGPAERLRYMACRLTSDISTKDFHL